MCCGSQLPTDSTSAVGMYALKGEASSIIASAAEGKSPRGETLSSLKVSVVVCAYTEGRWSQIQAALSSLAQQTLCPWQVIVVADNNFILLDRLRSAYPDLDVIPNKFAPGLSGARNTGIEHSEGDVIVFLDDDARADPGWLETLLASYEDDSVLGVGGMVLADWGTTQRPRWLPEEFLWVVGCSYEGMPNTKAEVRNPIGANMSFRRSAFARAGLFDSSIGRNNMRSRPLGCEETEFSIRLLQVTGNGKIFYEPRAVVHHHVDPSRGTWRYFLRRCYAEGCSKARVTRLTGAAAALSAERSYVVHFLMKAACRELKALIRPGGSQALGRLAALALGISWATAGYIRALAAKTECPSVGKGYPGDAGAGSHVPRSG
jgi:glucosyl-dolichyl phosphate glucuronosyltransferase